MNVSVSTKDPLKVVSDLKVFFVSTKWGSELALLDKNIQKQINNIASLEKFSGKAKQTLVIDNLNTRILLYGVGELKETKVYELQNIIGDSAHLFKNLKRKNICLVLNPKWFSLFSSNDLGRIVSESLYLSLNNFEKYITGDRKKEKITIEEITVVVDSSKSGEFEKGLETGKIFAEATIYARDLVNEPGGTMTPSHLAQKALEISKTENIKVTIFNEDQARKLGMNSYLAVGQGSDTPSKFIKLSYKPEKPAKKKIVIIGKGITFDSGGLSLKPGNAMETMKIDMAGAAAVLGVFSKIAKLKPDVEVTGLIASCENMPSGKALRPGDILKALNGKTIEVLNTDAEGRLTLADALSYAVKYEKPDAIIDLATLTGAMVAALGEEITGFFSNDQSLTQKISNASDVSGELMWEMPLYKRYQELIKSEVADLRNIAKSKYGGAISAALFLEEFVAKSPWAHLDIAGPAYTEKPIPLCSYGGTGFGVRFLLSLLSSY